LDKYAYVKGSYSQASDGKEALCGRQPTIFFFARYIFSFIALKKIKNTKNIFAETIRGTKISSPILGKIVTRFGQNVTRFCHPLKRLKIFLS